MSARKNPRPLFAETEVDGEASQVTRAFVGIRALLLRGQCPPGKRIPEVQLASRLGISRTPVRLALERLALIGLVDTGERGGFFVRSFSIKDVRDAIELRGVLEGMAARLAAERPVADEELGHLDGLANETEAAVAASRFDEYVKANERFHDAIVELADNDVLRRLLQQVNSLPFSSPSAMVSPKSTIGQAFDTVAVGLEHHRGLIDAIGRHQGARAEHLAREHAHLSWSVFEVALAHQDLLESVPGSPLIDLDTEGDSSRR